MMPSVWCWPLAAASFLLAGRVHSQSLEGTIEGPAATPLVNATVFVYSAALKHGFATVCPTCWVDCGKRAQSDSAGHFRIDNLDPALKFRLLVLKAGYVPADIEGADPARGELRTVGLVARPVDGAGAQRFSGRITDAQAHGIGGALIEPTAVKMPTGNELIGSIAGLDRLGVSDDDGTFELVSTERYESITVMVSPRGFAPAIVSDLAANHRLDIVAQEGVTVTGRLVQTGGSPVSGMEVSLVPLGNMNGTDFPVAKIGTDARGVFAFSNVPSQRVYRLAPGASLDKLHLTAPPRWLESPRDGEILWVRDYTLSKGIRLAGRVAMEAGADLPAGLYVALGDAYASGDNKVARVDPAGRFEFVNLPPGPYTLSVSLPDRPPSPPRQILLDKERTDVVLAGSR